jgi:hypothetical protein
MARPATMPAEAENQTLAAVVGFVTVRWATKIVPAHHHVEAELRGGDDRRAQDDEGVGALERITIALPSRRSLGL